MTIAELIRSCRGKMPLEDFALRCRTTYQSVGQWERGESLPTLGKLDILADIMELPYLGLLLQWVSEKRRREGYCDR